MSDSNISVPVENDVVGGEGDPSAPGNSGDMNSPRDDEPVDADSGPDMDAAIPPEDAGPMQTDSGQDSGMSVDAGMDAGMMGPCPDKSDKPCLVTIYAIKRAEAIAAQGEIVQASGVVTSTLGIGFFMQVPEDARPMGEGAADSGLFVFLGNKAASVTKPALGEWVKVTGTVGLFKGQTQLTSVTALSVLDASKVLPSPEVVAPAAIATGGAQASGLEGSLVKVENVEVDSVQSSGAFMVDGGLIVSDYLHDAEPAVVSGEVFLSITGVLHHESGTSKLEPRDELDLNRKLGLTRFSQATYTVTEGDSDVAVTIALNKPAPVGGATVTLSSDNTSLVTVPASVTVLEGATSAEVRFSAPAATGGGNTVLRASYDGSTAEMSVTVEALVLEVAVSKVIPAELVMGVGDTYDLTVRIDAPARAAGETVTVSVAGDAVTAPASVVVPESSTEVTLTVTAASEGSAKVTVSLGSSSVETPVTVIAASAPVLQLSEVLFDPSVSQDGGYEWIELYNAGDTTIDLRDYSLGWGGVDYFAFGKLDLVGHVAPGGCFLVGGNKSDAGNGNPKFDQEIAQFSGNLQNSGSDADGIGLFQGPKTSITKDSVPLDAVIYGGSNSAGLLGPDGTAPAPHVGDTTGKSIGRTATGWIVQPVLSPNDCSPLM